MYDIPCGTQSIANRVMLNESKVPSVCFGDKRFSVNSFTIQFFIEANLRLIEMNNHMLTSFIICFHLKCSHWLGNLANRIEKLPCMYQVSTGSSSHLSVWIRWPPCLKLRHIHYTCKRNILHLYSVSNEGCMGMRLIKQRKKCGEARWLSLLGTGFASQDKWGPMIMIWWLFWSQV